MRAEGNLTIGGVIEYYLGLTSTQVRKGNDKRSFHEIKRILGGIELEDKEIKAKTIAPSIIWQNFSAIPAGSLTLNDLETTHIRGSLGRLLAQQGG